LFSIAMLAMAQQSQTTTKTAPIQRTSGASGQEMFDSYCAACHGKDAKGNGPVAAALNVPPPDLTTLSQRHGGKYPATYVESVLKFGAENFPAHGTKDMPVWGPLLGSISGGVNAPMTAQRIYNLTRYLEGLQAKWTPVRLSRDFGLAETVSQLSCAGWAGTFWSLWGFWEMISFAIMVVSPALEVQQAFAGVLDLWGLAPIVLRWRGWRGR
jgi:mono/diheme cytochrome c family protein